MRSAQTIANVVCNHRHPNHSRRQTKRIARAAQELGEVRLASRHPRNAARAPRTHDSADRDEERKGENPHPVRPRERQTNERPSRNKTPKGTGTTGQEERTKRTTPSPHSWANRAPGQEVRALKETASNPTAPRSNAHMDGSDARDGVAQPPGRQCPSFACPRVAHSVSTRMGKPSGPWKSPRNLTPDNTSCRASSRGGGDEHSRARRRDRQ